MYFKSYNPHCVDWGNCKIRVEDDCMGCNKNKRATSILITRIFNHINQVGLMGDHEWINLRKYSVMLLNDFVDTFLNNEEYNCIEINLHVENHEDLNIITNEILNLRDNYKFSKPAITRGDY